MGYLPTSHLERKRITRSQPQRPLLLSETATSLTMLIPGRQLLTSHKQTERQVAETG